MRKSPVALDQAPHTAAASCTCDPGEASATVPIYYLRLVERHTNRLRYRYVIEAADDEQALAKAED